MATEVLDRLPTTRKPPKRPLKYWRPVCDELLVRIEVAAALHCCGLCSAERLGIADEHDGQRAGHEFLQFYGVELGSARWGALTEDPDHTYIAAALSNRPTRIVAATATIRAAGTRGARRRSSCTAMS